MKKLSKKELEEELKKELEENRAQLALLDKQNKSKKKAAKVEKLKKKADKVEKPKKRADKVEKPKKKAAKAEKPKKKAAKVEEEKPEIPKTMEEQFEDTYTDEELRNFRIEKKDMEQLTNRVCEIVASYGDDGMLQSELWKKLKLSVRDGSRLSLRLERRGMITREKILQNGRWTYRLIIEQVPISLESIQNAPCLTCPVEQKCNIDNVYPEPSPKHCELIEEWVIEEYKRKK